MKYSTLKNTLKTISISILSATLAIAIYNQISPQETQTVATKEEAIKQYANLPITPAINTDFTQAASKAVDAVVHVTVLVETEALAYGNSFLDFFFGDGTQPKTYKREQMGSGSGVIISKDGYIVTNNHVIDNSKKIKVKFNDNREYVATLVGSDPVTDIAVIKIDNKDNEDFPTLSFGNSEALKVGEWVLAVGNPFSLSTTVTAGIVSAKGRNMYNMQSSQREKISIESFIQTDAAVNPGNSGGALVNTNGDLIGINTAIASPTGTYAGYAFAVPSTIVKKVVADIIEYGEIKRAYIGISISDINKELAEEKGLKTLKGAYVAGLSENGAAKEAGIKTNDVITSVNGTAVSSMSELQEQVSRYRPGDQITVSVLRNNNVKKMSVLLRDEYGNKEVVENTPLARLGVELQPATDELKDNLGINNGLQIVKLDNGKLRNKGIQLGYIITKINNQPIRSTEDINRLLENVEGGLFITGIYPNGKVAYYAIDMNE